MAKILVINRESFYKRFDWVQMATAMLVPLFDGTHRGWYSDTSLSQ